MSHSFLEGHPYPINQEQFTLASSSSSNQSSLQLERVSSRTLPPGRSLLWISTLQNGSCVTPSSLMPNPPPTHTLTHTHHPTRITTTTQTIPYPTWLLRVLSSKHVETHTHCLDPTALPTAHATGNKIEIKRIADARNRHGKFCGSPPPEISSTH